MKQDVSPGIIAVIAIVLVAIIGFFAYKTFGPHSNAIVNEKALAAKAQSEKMAKQPHVDMKNYSKDNRPPGSSGGQ